MSYRRAERPKLVDHRHCKICAKAIPPNEEFCSEACRMKFEEWQRKERRGRYVLYIIYAVIMAALFLFLVLRPPPP